MLPIPYPIEAQVNIVEQQDKRQILTDQASTRNTDTIKGIPSCDAARLLSTGIVHRCDEHESRVGNGLKGSRQDAKSEEATEVVRRGLSHEESPPHEDVEGEVVCWWTALHEEVGRDGPEQPTEVEAT